MAHVRPILAKLSAPQTDGVVPRPRLFRRLDAYRRRRLLWIVGPPGSGKTALVASWARQRKLRCLWVRLDDADSDVATLFHYLGLAAQKMVGRRSGLPSFNRDDLAAPGSFARRFFRTLYALRRPPTVVVLDDYHELRSDSPVHTALCDGIDELPAGAAVVITSRTEPPAAMLRLQVSGQLEVLRGDELLLTPREACALAGQWGCSARDRRAVLALHTRSEGWVAGLVLLLASRRHGGDERQWGEGEDALFGYFAGEVFDRTDPVARTVLLETAFLPRVPASIAIELTGVARAGEILADLARRGYFVARHGGTAPTYEYHALFRAFLLERAERELPPERGRELRIGAAQQFEKAGQQLEALDLFTAVGAWDEAARLILAVRPALMKEMRLDTLARAIQRLPEERWGCDPWLLFWLGVAQLTADPAQSRAYEERALELFEAAGEAAGTYGSLAMICFARQQESDDLAPLDDWIRRLEEARRRFPRFPFAQVEKSVVSAALSALSTRQPWNPWLREWEERALALALAPGDPGIRWEMCDALLSRYARWAENLTRARLLVETFRSQPTTTHSPPLNAIGWFLGSACLHLYLGDAEACREDVERGLALTNERGFHDRWDTFLFGMHGYAAVLGGDLGAARKAIERAAAAAKGAPRGTRCTFHQAASVVARHAGDADLAREHGWLAVDLAKAAGMMLEEATARLARALAQPTESAEGELEEVLALARRCSLRIVQVGSLLGLALAALRRGAHAQAVERVREGFRVGRELGVLHLPWLLRGELVDCCGLALEHDVEAEHVCALIRIHRLEPSERARDLEAWPWELRIEALRGFAVKRQGKLLEVGRKVQKKPLEMLQLLVARGEAGMPQDTLAEALWRDAEGDAARRALNTNLYRLRKLLGSVEAVVQREGRIALNSGLVFVDVWALRRLLDRIEATEGRTEVVAARLEDLRARLRARYSCDAPEGEDAEPPLGELRVRLHRRMERRPQG